MANGGYRDRKAQRIGENLDVLLGLLAFAGLVLVIVTVVVQMSGQPAWMWSLALLAWSLCCGTLWKIRSRIRPRPPRNPTP